MRDACRQSFLPPFWPSAALEVPDKCEGPVPSVECSAACVGYSTTATRTQLREEVRDTRVWLHGCRCRRT